MQAGAEGLSTDREDSEEMQALKEKAAGNSYII